MKICFILEYYHPHVGGMEYLFQNICERLAARGHHITVVTQRLQGTPASETVAGVHIIRIRTGNRYLFGPLAVMRALMVARSSDVLHTSTFNSAFPAWCASKLLRVPVVITVLEVWLGQWRAYTDLSKASAFVHDLLERMLYALPFHQYVAISRSTERQLTEAGISSDRVRTIYCGFDEAFFDPKRYDRETVRTRYGLQGSFVCFSWGRPGFSKGHEYLLRAMPRIVRSIPQVKLVLMLSGRETYGKRYEYLTQIIAKLQIQDTVLLVDPAPRSEIGHFLKAADCAIIPSIAEGFGYAVLEACSMGTPVVASDTTSIPEVIGGKYVLVRPRDPEAIAEGVERIYRKSYSTSEVKVFPWDNTVQGYIDVYGQLMKK
jgi:D-inositol-3-phosphate glycosyltransferase